MNTVDVWRASLDKPADEVARLWNLLSAAERDRAGQFHKEIDRARYTVCRGTLRTLLGDYTSMPAKLVPIGVLPNGKPSLGAALSPQDLHFNLSHCGGLALFAFANQEIGIDVERVEPKADIRGVVAKVFAPDEIAMFEQLGESDRQRFFFRTWVRKEAYLKATGDGFSVDPATVSVGDSFESGKSGIAERFRILDIDEVDGHAAAIAFAGNGPVPRIHFRLV